MTFRADSNKLSLVRATLLVLGLVTLSCNPTVAQTQAERFWLAGRYDGDRIVVYFDSVKFKGTLPPNAPRLPYPVAEGFFSQIELPASYIAQFQKEPNAEHFALGDQYDLLLGNGGVETVTLATLIGCETDEGVGNDSYIGALATLNKRGHLFFTKGYYAVRRHREPTHSGAKPRPMPRAIHASLLDEPVRFDIQTRIAALLRQRMKTMATDTERLEAEKISPAFEVQSFRIGDGSVRYYARAEWRREQKLMGKPTYVLADWLKPVPRLQIVATEKRTSQYGFQSELPNLLNVVDLGGGKTGLVVLITQDEGRSLSLVEYRDGVSLRDMRVLQSISMGE